MKTSILALLLSIALLFSGCSGLSFDSNDLLQPPKLTEEQSRIYAALEAAIDGPFTLEYPSRGEFRAAFLFLDVNADGVNEAIAFYTPQPENTVEQFESNVRINVLQRDEAGNWSSRCDIAGRGTGVDQVQPVKILSGSQNQLIVGWTQFDSQQKTITVLDDLDGRLQTVWIGTYRDFIVIDSESMGLQEMVLLNPPSEGENSSYAELVGMAEDRSIESRSRCDINPDVQEYVSIQQGVTEEGSIAVCIDEAINASSLVTEILSVEGSQIRNLTYTKDVNQTLTVLRPIGNLSVDVDGDGQFEIPTLSPLINTNSETDREPIYLTTYYKLIDQTFQPAMRLVINEEYGYAYRFPDYFTNVTVVADYQTREWKFLMLWGEQNEYSQEIMRIKVYKTGDIKDKFDEQSYIYAGSRGTFEYYAYLAEPPKTGETGAIFVSKDEFFQNFIILS